MHENGARRKGGTADLTFFPGVLPLKFIALTLLFAPTGLRGARPPGVVGLLLVISRY